MNVYSSIESAAGKLIRAVVTTGSFDGVHVGHKQIIQSLNEYAEEISGESTLITFDPHPRKVLYPHQKDFNILTTKDEKISLLEESGLHNLIIHPFSLEFSKTTSHDFITKYLSGMLNAKVIVVGNNHNYGHNREGDYTYLYDLSNKHNFKVEEIPMKHIENEVVSSMKIRKALLAGNISLANSYFGYEYFVTGKLISSTSHSGNETTDSFEIQIEDEEKLMPPPGNYIGNIIQNDVNIKAKATVNNNSDDKFRLIIRLMQKKQVIENNLAKFTFTDRTKY